ncbi:MAG: 3-deoxy-D-manno-octulosonic acid transferase [Planctomycetota bacterium]
MPTLLAWLLDACYAVVLFALSPVIAWQAWRTGKYREGYREKLLGQVPTREGDKFCVWLHAVSVGEVNLLATTIGEIRRRQPDWELVISTTTKTGYDLAQKKYGAESEWGLAVFYCPLDFSWAVRRAMQRVRPNLLVLAELELWPNLIAGAKVSGAQVAIINGRLSDNSFRGYCRVGKLVRRVLGQCDLIAAQDEATAERFRALGANQVVVTGSLKYDGAETDRQNARTAELRELAGFDESQTVWLAGSTQAPEEQICINVFTRLQEEFPNLRLVLVPRHPERFDEVATQLTQSGIPWQRRTKLNESAIRNPQTAILLIDSVGELGAWWGTAQIGFVGGSFGDRGGQNMIEPAAYGVATCFGPNTRNFRDIVAALLAADAATVVADEQALDAFVRRSLTDLEFATQLGERASAFVATQLGATTRTVDRLQSLAAGSGKTSLDAA